MKVHIIVFVFVDMCILNANASTQLIDDEIKVLEQHCNRFSVIYILSCAKDYLADNIKNDPTGFVKLTKLDVMKRTEKASLKFLIRYLQGKIDHYRMGYRQ